MMNSAKSLETLSDTIKEGGEASLTPRGDNPSQEPPIQQTKSVRFKEDKTPVSAHSGQSSTIDGKNLREAKTGSIIAGVSQNQQNTQVTTTMDLMKFAVENLSTRITKLEKVITDAERILQQQNHQIRQCVKTEKDEWMSKF